MRNFSESLRTTKHMKLLEQTLELMARRNIDPMRFVDWYTEIGVFKQDQGVLGEASEAWLETELMFAEGFWDGAANVVGNMANMAGRGVGFVRDNFKAGLNGNPAAPGSPPAAPAPGGPAPAPAPGGPAPAPAPGGPAPAPAPGGPAPAPAPAPGGPDQQIAPASQAAHKAISDLSARFAQSSVLKTKISDPEFGKALVTLSMMLKDPKQILHGDHFPPTPSAPASPTPAPAPVPAPAPTPAPAPAAPSPSVSAPAIESAFSQYLRKNNLKMQIQQGLIEVQSYNIDPQGLVDWYANEGRYMNENMFQGVTDWLGNTWANLKGAWGRARSQWGEEGKARQTAKDTERDTAAIKAAMQALDSLEKIMKDSGLNPHEEFGKLLTAVRQQLQQVNAAPAPTPTPAPAPAPAPTPTPAPAPAPTP